MVFINQCSAGHYITQSACQFRLPNFPVTRHSMRASKLVSIQYRWMIIYVLFMLYCIATTLPSLPTPMERAGSENIFLKLERTPLCSVSVKPQCLFQIRFSILMDFLIQWKIAGRVTVLCEESVFFSFCQLIALWNKTCQTRHFYFLNQSSLNDIYICLLSFWPQLR